MYYQSYMQMKKMLGQIEKWLDATEAFAKEKSVDPNVFLNFRLAPDQFPLVRQIQATCDVAKLGASRLAGKEPPKHPDTEQTLDEIRARIRSVIGYLESFSEKDFERAATQTISQPRWEGKTMAGADYFLEHAQPNFFFHLSHSFAILRHNGVPIGKRDYLGALSLR
ncbi:MAG TPA: DUF1993 domain-containing protein [Polyangiaceae bacterium]|jgi:hypothetical protein